MLKELSQDKKKTQVKCIYKLIFKMAGMVNIKLAFMD